MTNESFSIDMTDLETRAKVRLVTMISALTFEVGTGMKMNRNANALAALKQTYPEFKGNKRKALEFAVDKMKELDPDYIPGTRTQIILDKEN